MGGFFFKLKAIEKLIANFKCPAFFKRPVERLYEELGFVCQLRLISVTSVKPGSMILCWVLATISVTYSISRIV
jgi:hypothetical protein